jgi:hypothetical protein
MSPTRPFNGVRAAIDAIWDAIHFDLDIAFED